ncbi:hypothetical protein BN1708_003695 [Verticillium longisporum]|uniref:Secreted protein n=1 Tax=Verticillium longisporum TaxID=100787 RepID=A0A0G4LN14_VERLO|nr:hypothetical protein BN1708_003695 [Verticillium longisporum]
MRVMLSRILAFMCTFASAVVDHLAAGATWVHKHTGLGRATITAPVPSHLFFGSRRTWKPALVAGTLV